MKIIMQVRLILYFLTALHIQLAEGAELQAIAFQLNDKKMSIHPPNQLEGDALAIPRLIASTIKEEIVSGAVKSEGINVSREFLSKSIELYFAWAGVSDETVTATSNRLTNIVGALRAVVVEGANNDTAFERHLRGTDVTLEEWRKLVRIYSSEQDIKKLEQAIPKSLASMKQHTEESLRRDLETALLVERWSKSIVPTRQEIQSMYQRLYPAGTPPLDEVINHVRNQTIGHIRQEYLERRWKSELEKHKIEVPQEYRDAVYAHLEAIPAPILPDSIFALLREMSKDDAADTEPD